MDPLTHALRRHPDLVHRRVAGELLLVPVRGGVASLAGIFRLNEVGSFVWERLDGERPASTLIPTIVADFEVEPEAAEGDLRTFLDGLLARGLVEVVPA